MSCPQTDSIHEFLWFGRKFAKEEFNFGHQNYVSLGCLPVLRQLTLFGALVTLFLRILKVHFAEKERRIISKILILSKTEFVRQEMLLFRVTLFMRGRFADNICVLYIVNECYLTRFCQTKLGVPDVIIHEKVMFK